MPLSPHAHARTRARARPQDAGGHHSSALFVQWVPYELSGGRSWEQEEEGYVRHLLSIVDSFAPGAPCGVGRLGSSRVGCVGVTACQLQLAGVFGPLA
jgi:hypothetical protein